MEYIFLNRKIEVPLANQDLIGPQYIFFLCTQSKFNSPCAADDFRQLTGNDNVFVIPGGLEDIQTKNMFGMREVVFNHLKKRGVVIAAIEDAGIMLESEIKKNFSTQSHDIDFNRIIQLKSNGVVTKDEADRILSFLNG